MKVTGFEVFPVVCPPPFRGGRSWLFVRLDTDSGTHGYGEMMLLGTGFRLPVLATMMADIIEQAVIGHDPYDTEMLFDKVYGRAGYSHYPELTKLGILSAIEMACWDIIGKDCGQPVYKLLGGEMRDRVRTYTYIYDDPAANNAGAGNGRPLSREVWLNPAYAASRARHYADLGFTAIKVDPFSLTLTHDQSLGQNVPLQFSLSAADTAERVIGAIRDEVGTACDIIIGTHGQMTAAGALRIAQRLEKFDPLWYEEPCPPENMKALAEVARRTTIPIATGERLTTKFDFARLHRAPRRGDLQLRRRPGGRHRRGQEDREHGRGALHTGRAARLRRAAHRRRGAAPVPVQPQLPHHGGGRALRRGARAVRRVVVRMARRLPDAAAASGLGFELREDVARSHAPRGPQPGTIRSY